MRTFSGAEQFDALKKTVVGAYTNLFPVWPKGQEGTGYSLHLNKLWVDDEALDPQDFTSQKKARLAGNTWGAPVYAAIDLKDPEGHIIDHLSKVRLSTIPRLTPRGSYIVGGNEYQISNQLRRKMGVYVVRRKDGDQYKATFNMGGEFARNFEVHYDPAKLKYKVKVNQAWMPLYPLARALGTTDAELEKAWGKEIFAANKIDAKKLDALTLKYAKRFTNTKSTDLTEAKTALTDYAKRVTVDPVITELTLGKKYDHLHPQMLVDASQKLSDVYQGKRDPDDPENLLFKEILSTEDMVHDVLTSKKRVDAMKYMLSRHLGKRTKIRDIIDFKKLSGPVEHFFTSDNRSSTPEQYNPVHMLSEMHKLTMMGTGGISDPHTVTSDIREVHPSHLGFIDSYSTPESEKIGVVLHLTTGAVKDGRAVRTPVINTKTHKLELLTPHELYTKNVAFPDEADEKGKFRHAVVRAQKLGKLSTIPHKDVDYIFPTASTLYTHSTNLVPFLQNDQGNRIMMASKMIGQAIPLVEREAPLVQTEMTPTKTFQQAIGEQFSLHSPVDGKVTKVTADNIEVGGKKLALYHHFPLNQKTYIHHLPVVKEGDLVKRGQLLADTNYTDKGVLALGKNLTVAYLPYPGLTFEDGIVITESASKKLASQHIFKHSFEVEHGAREASLKKFQAYYPTQVRRESIKNFDDDGVIKKGSTVRPGEVVIMGLRYDMQSPENMTLKRINKALQKPWSNASVRYNGEFAGTVTDVVKRQDHIDVYVMATEPAKESDKLSGIHGNKGVITKVVADADAPHMANGSVPDVFLNPHGIIGRINLGQIYESAAGKIATKTGKPYVVKNFSPEPSNEKIAKDLKAHEISDLEEMYLPNGNAIGKVHVGRPYILRLAKTGKSGFSARMPGTGYDLNMQPTKGGEEGSKALDLMTFYSMLSHGAKKNLVDAHQKSEKNDEYWHAIEMGKPIPAPKPTFAFQKFISLLHGAGINTVKRGSDIVLAPLTDGAVRRMSHGAITEPEFLYGKDLKEKKGGFFDPHATGGLKGTHYSHIELREQLPNPVFESAIKSLTGLKSEDYQAIVSGMKYVTADGKLTDTKTPHTGGAAIGQLLSKIDIDAELKSAQSKILTTKNDAELNALNRKLRYLHALKDLDLKPQDAYMRKVVPVIPPVYRPVYEVPGKGLQVAPANELYRSLGILDRSHEYPAMKLLADSEKKDLRTDTYRATRALAGLEPVETRGKDYPIEGFISQITGSKPKDGFFLSKIINKRQDLVGRGVITSAPDFDVDELGVPEKMAWNIFRPFIVREFTMAGVGADVARQEIDAKTPRAKQMLLSAMNKRTVLMNRAPSLHKFSIMAFKPRLTEGLAVRVPPLVLKGFGGDFDGDAVTIHVPTSEEAIRESHKMFPSQNLFKPGTGELMISPSQESAIGLYFLSQESKGRDQINKLLPEKYRITGPMDAKAAKALYDRIAKEDTGTYHKIVFHLKQLGDKTAYERGFSVGVQDTIVDTKPRDLVFAQADKNAALVKKDDAKVSAIYIKAAKDAYGELKKEMKAKGNSFYHMVTSGARGKDSQLMQLISAPGIVNDAKDRPVPVPIKRSYAEGLSTSDHFISAYGARKGMMDRAIQTSAPGALSKDIMANTLDNVVTVHDCGTHEGISLPVTNADVYDRFLAKDQHGFKRNDPVTPQMVSSLNKHRVHDIIVRTPLQCLAKKGTCALCYGNDEHGGPPQVGENIGAKVGQTMSETTTQLSMKTFHTGGVAGGGPSMGGFARVQQLLRMPEYVAGEAALATQAGKITHTKKLATGGYHVHVGDKLHVVPTNRELKVGVGDHVAAGDPLSQGVLRPQDLRKYKGMKVAQDYIVDQLKSSYDAQLSEPMQRRVFETVIRSVAGNTRVVKAPHGSDFKEGELIPFPIAEHYNKTRSVEMPLHDAVGYHLKDHTGNLPALHKLTDKDVEHLKGLGYTKLGVLKDPLIHAPLLKGIERLPLEKKNWMAQLGYRYIKDTLTEGSAQAWKSQLDGNHPVPAFAYGAAFGQKKEHY